MLTYIRYRVATGKITAFVSQLKVLEKLIEKEGLIKGFSFSQCVSESENFIFSISWNKPLIKNENITNQHMQETLRKLLDDDFKDYILEIRNYQSL